MGRHLQASAVPDDAGLPWTVAVAIRGPGTIVTGPRRSATGRHAAGAEPALEKTAPAAVPTGSMVPATRRRPAGRTRGPASVRTRRGAAVLPLHALDPSAAEPSPANERETGRANRGVHLSDGSHPVGIARRPATARSQPDPAGSPAARLPVRHRRPWAGTPASVEDRPDLDTLRRVLAALHRL